jgi:type I restriction enzyme M protein
VGCRQLPAGIGRRSRFKAYIFPLLFFKRISDAWDDEHDAAVAEYGPGADPEL